MAEKKMGMSMGAMCHHGQCYKCHSVKAIVVGLLVLANQIWGFLSWGSFIGGLLVIAGILKLAMPTCPHCK